MKIYVGYILSDYAQALYVGLKKEKIEKALNSHSTKKMKWVEEYELKENQIVKLDCD